MTTRTSSAQWRGSLKDGDGEVEIGDGVFRGAYTFASRFEEGDGTNPEELIGAAHAACYSMFLSGVLTGEGLIPTSIDTRAEVHLERVDDKPTVTKVALTTRAEVDGLDADAFVKHAETAKDGCPISRLLAPGTEITLDAQLAD